MSHNMGVLHAKYMGVGGGGGGDNKNAVFTAS